MNNDNQIGIQLSNLYDSAMANWSDAYLSRHTGDMQLFTLYGNKALAQLEEASSLILPHTEAEPTRSIICKSTAEIALQLGFASKAIKYSAMGISGNPDEDILEQLHGIMQDASHHMHYQVKGMILSEEEIQISFTGKSVGYGYIPYKVLLNKMIALESILIRTAERYFKLPFRSHGKTKNVIMERVSMYAGVPRAASYAFTIRLGETADDDLFGSKSEILSEFLKCAQLLSDGKEEALKEAIPDKKYYNNFISLTAELAPDGEDITNIYFTASKNEPLNFSITQNQIRGLKGLAENDEQSERVEMTGILDKAVAGADEDLVRISGKIFSVPLELEDVVSLNWRKMVKIAGIKTGNKIKLLSIEPI